MARPFLAMDVDGVIFKSSLVEKAADYGVRDGLFKPEPFNAAYETRRRWQANNSEGTYNAYLDQMVGAFAQQMAGVEVERFERVTSAMIAEHQVRRFAFPRQLIRRLNRSHHIIAISGSPKILVEPFLADLGIDEIYGSTYEHVDGRFTDNAMSVGDKRLILHPKLTRGEVTQEGSVAIGDTYSDKTMLHLAENSIMFNASRTLTDYGRAYGWTRVNEHKDQITALQYSPDLDGYREVSPEEILHEISQK